MSLNFRQSEVWKLSRVQNIEIIQILSTSKLERLYKFKDQIFRSSGSVMDNIAEGFERDGNRELIQFLSIAKGSNGELSSQITRLLDMQIITEIKHGEMQKQSAEISKQIGGFITYLKRSEMQGSKKK
ncbi:MAG: four helix bundle protein [Flavobacteriales bacterium]